MSAGVVSILISQNRHALRFKLSAAGTQSTAQLMLLGLLLSQLSPTGRSLEHRVPVPVQPGAAECWGPWRPCLPGQWQRGAQGHLPSGTGHMQQHGLLLGMPTPKTLQVATSPHRSADTRLDSTFVNLCKPKPSSQWKEEGDSGGSYCLTTVFLSGHGLYRVLNYFVPIVIKNRNEVF